MPRRTARARTAISTSVDERLLRQGADRRTVSRPFRAGTAFHTMGPVPAGGWAGRPSTEGEPMPHTSSEVAGYTVTLEVFVPFEAAQRAVDRLDAAWRTEAWTPESAAFMVARDALAAAGLDGSASVSTREVRHWAPRRPGRRGPAHPGRTPRRLRRSRFPAGSSGGPVVPDPHLGRTVVAAAVAGRPARRGGSLPADTHDDRRADVV